MITAAILAGGKGTRIRAVLGDKPKVLAPVGGRPFLTYLLDQSSEAGIRRVVLCTGYLAEQVKNTFGERYRDLDILYSQEDCPLGTAGALAKALPVLDSDPVLVFNGDSYCDVSLSAFLNWHSGRDAFGSMVLTYRPDAARYGCVNVDSNGNILAFAEKKAAGPGWINAGIYLLSHKLLRSIPQMREVSLEYDVFPTLVGNGLLGFATHTNFVDIGTPSSYANAEAAVVSRASSVDSPVSPESSLTSRRYVILDRDGTINVERHYLSDPDQFELLPGAVEGLRHLSSLGLGLVVISNQSALGRGYFAPEQLAAIHSRMRDLLQKEGVQLSGIYFCPHRPEENCCCRKPETGLGHQAAAELGFDLKTSFVVGDKDTDIAFGRRLGATTLLVRTGYGKRMEESSQHGADYIVNDLREAASLIADQLAGNSEGMIHGVGRANG